jgi:hypothetical protein
MVKETLDAAMKAKAIKASDIEHVNIDTTVQPKNVAPPTDLKLYHRAREVLVKAAKKAGIVLRLDVSGSLTRMHYSCIMHLNRGGDEWRAYRFVICQKTCTNP